MGQKLFAIMVWHQTSKVMARCVLPKESCAANVLHAIQCVLMSIVLNKVEAVHTIQSILVSIISEKADAVHPSSGCTQVSEIVGRCRS